MSILKVTGVVIPPINLKDHTLRGFLLWNDAYLAAECFMDECRDYIINGDEIIIHAFSTPFDFRTRCYVNTIQQSEYATNGIEIL